MSFKTWDYYNKLENYHSNLISKTLKKDITYSSSGYFPEYDCIINNKTFEIKTDLGANVTNNIVIEILNTKLNKNSGINSTSANFWSNTYYIDNQWYIGIVKVKILKIFLKKGLLFGKFRKTLNNKSGDNNCKLVIIPCVFFNKLISEFGIKIKCTDPNTWVN